MLTFDGLRAGRGPLTCGQRIVMASLSQRTEDADYTYNIDRMVPVPPGVDLAGVRAAVHALVCGHETLRTRVDGAEQIVDGSGKLAVLVCGSVTEARDALGTAPFDSTAEWGIRVAVVCRDDRPRSVLLCLSHLAVDAWAANLVVDDLRGRLRAPARETTARQPLEQAAVERTPDSLVRQADALTHLREMLLAAPQEGSCADPDDWHLGELRSTVVDPAARVVAARCRTTAAVVYLAATGVLLGGRHVLKTISHNRMTPAEQTCAAPFALDMFVPVDATDAPFDTVVARTWAAYRAAGRHARYDPAAVRPLVAEVAAARGTRPDLSVLVNDLRASTRPAAAPAATTFRWGEPFRLPGLTRYLAIADDGAAVVLSLLANGSALPRDEVPEFLHGLERLLVTEAGGVR